LNDPLGVLGMGWKEEGSWLELFLFSCKKLKNREVRLGKTETVNSLRVNPRVLIWLDNSKNRIYGT
jgi:hypothetical protein